MKRSPDANTNRGKHAISSVRLSGGFPGNDILQAKFSNVFKLGLTMCRVMFTGDSVNYTINGTPYTLQGSGDGAACEALIDEYVYKVMPPTTQFETPEQSLMPQLHSTTGPVRFLSPVRFLTRSIRPSEAPLRILGRCCSRGHIRPRAPYGLTRLHTYGLVE